MRTILVVIAYEVQKLEARKRQILLAVKSKGLRYLFSITVLQITTAQTNGNRLLFYH